MDTFYPLEYNFCIFFIHVPKHVVDIPKVVEKNV